MPSSPKRPSRGQLRRLWFNIHLWLGVALTAALIPLGLSGAVLVWSDAVDAGLHPARQVSAAPTRLPPTAYLAAAQDAALAAGEKMRPAQVTYPATPGRPVIVALRGGGGRPDGEGRGRRGVRGEARPSAAAGGPMGAPQRLRSLSVYLDPATARMLDTAKPRTGLMAQFHQFHESFFIPGWGRSAVGWLGVAMLISSVTGLYLWWPRGSWGKGLAYRRTPLTTLNLHYTAGFWIALPLAVLSLTGVGLGFPKTTRGLIAQIAPVSPAPGGPNGARGQGPTAQTALDADAAMARAGASPQTLASLSVPTRARPVWRVEPLTGPAMEVDDATGAAAPAPPLPAGDVAYRWIKRIHDGEALPLVWRAIITLGGLAPTLLGVTGVVAWISRSLRRRALKR